MEFYNTLRPYRTIRYEGIQYGVCRDYSHISRYRGLRQVTHNPITTSERYVALETPNAFTTNQEVLYYDVPAYLENRLDVIAQELLGDATYSWVIAYFNQIEDGYSAPAGQRLMVPISITALFGKQEILAPINPTVLNLGTE